MPRQPPSRNLAELPFNALVTGHMAAPHRLRLVLCLTTFPAHTSVADTIGKAQYHRVQEQIRLDKQILHSRDTNPLHPHKSDTPELTAVIRISGMHARDRANGTRIAQIVCVIHRRPHHHNTAAVAHKSAPSAASGYQPDFFFCSTPSRSLDIMQTAFFGSTKAFKAEGVKAGTVRICPSSLHLCRCTGNCLLISERPGGDRRMSWRHATVGLAGYPQP